MLKFLDNFPNIKKSNATKKIPKELENLAGALGIEDQQSSKNSFCFELSRRESYQSYLTQLERESIGEPIQNQDIGPDIDENFDFDAAENGTELQKNASINNQIDSLKDDDGFIPPFPKPMKKTKTLTP